MTKLDLKDRMILYELDLNSRQSDKQIGKKIGLSKQVVDYRIKRMENEGIIKSYYTAIDTFKLGYEVFRIYITFHYVSSDKKKEIIQYFVNYKNTWTVVTAKGEVDLNVIIWVKDNYEFYQFWNKTLKLYNDYFSKSIISIYIQTIDYKSSYLIDKYNEEDRELYRITSSEKTVKIDEIDTKLLNELAKDARKPLIDIAKIIGCSSQSLSYRIKNLINKGIIKAFRIHIDYLKINLSLFRIDIYLKSYKQVKPILDYLNKKPCLQCLNFSIGWADIEPEFVVEDVDELNNIIDDLSSKFPNAIRKTSYWINEKRHLDRWMPKMDFNK